MIYLDTHVLVWLYAKEQSRFPAAAQKLIEEHDLLISPMAYLELEYLYETGRVTEPPNVLVDYLADRMPLRVCDLPFGKVALRAAAIRWTRDPFDRIIVAQASLGDTTLLTKDETMRTHYPYAAWS